MGGEGAECVRRDVVYRMGGRGRMGVEEGDDTSACSEAVKGRRENERKRRGVCVCVNGTIEGSWCVLGVLGRRACVTLVLCIEQKK